MSPELSAPAVRFQSAFARHWAASAALLLIVIAAALVQFARAPRVYTATQQLEVVVLSDGSGAASPPPDAAALASALADPAILSSPRLAGDVLSSLPATMASSSGASSLQRALTANVTGATLTLSATWTSTPGAQALLSAAVHALQTDDAVLPAGAANDSARIQALTPASPATRSAVEASAQVQTLIQRLLMGAIAAALLPFVLNALLSPRAPSPPVD